MIFLHNNASDFVYKPKRNQLYMTCKIQKGMTEEVLIKYYDRVELIIESVQMKKKYEDETFDYFTAVIHEDSYVSYLKYYFEVKPKETDEVIYFGPHGEEKTPPTYPFEFLYLNEGEVSSPPSWLKSSIFYQIFPERFYNGDKSNDHKDTVEWSSSPSRENYMGGDLKGIIDKIDYLTDLKINCLYLTPIFLADFNHKYATTDYYEVDPLFGNKQTLHDLVNICHKNNIRILLDGVFNHSGINFFAFKDILKNQEESIYKHWYYIKKFPVEISEENYECVGNYKWMPKLNTSNVDVQNYFIDVMSYWIEEFDIDGWRLDVADEVDKLLLLRANQWIKQKYGREKALVGETWGYPNDMLTENQVDSVMNYVFRDNMINYICNDSISNRTFINRSEKMYGKISDVYNDSLYNLLDSHDTERFFTLCKENVGKFKLAVILQFVLKGAPAVYYGDEIGMTGYNDPDCRKGMEWEKVNPSNDILNHYKKCIDLRTNYKVLQNGEINLYDIDKLLKVERIFNDEKIVLFTNNSKNALSINEDLSDVELIYSSSDNSNKIEEYGFRLYKNIVREEESK